MSAPRAFLDVDSTRATRLDILVFLGAFLFGLAAYFLLRALHTPQEVITGVLVLSMIAYAVGVATIPRLRVRFDQAGDNAYYLGLLFTLVSMAFALYDFGHQTTSASGVAERSAAIRIIGDFGVALATTITGIFARVILHQMRVDPADVEGATRIELAEAAKRVKAVLDTVSIAIGRLLDEMHQRSSDQLVALTETAGKTVQDFASQAGEITSKMIQTMGSVHQQSLEGAASMTARLAIVTAEAEAAVTRLRKIEPPPLEWQQQLEILTSGFRELAAGAQQAGGELRSAVAAYKGLNDSLATSATTLSQSAAAVRQDQDDAMERVRSSADRFAGLLRSMGDKLENDRNHLTELEQQSQRASEAAVHAAESASTVLERLVAVTRGLVDLLNNKA